MECTSDGLIAMVVEHKIGVVGSRQPLLNTSLVLLQSVPDGELRKGTVGVGGGCGNAFVRESFAELIVGAADMFAQGVASRPFVSREIVRGSAEVGVGDAIHSRIRCLTHSWTCGRRRMGLSAAQAQQEACSVDAGESLRVGCSERCHHESSARSL